MLPADRDPGMPATSVNDPYNAAIRWCRIRAEFDGPLAGMRIGVKDSVAVAGVPLTCGSPVLRAFVPSRDSVVAARLLRAGAQIVCTTNMDDLATSGGGDTSAFGYTRNPSTRPAPPGAPRADRPQPFTTTTSTPRSAATKAAPFASRPRGAP